MQLEERVVVQETQDERVHVICALGAVRQQRPQILVRAHLIEVKAARLREERRRRAGNADGFVVRVGDDVNDTATSSVSVRATERLPCPRSHR